MYGVGRRSVQSRGPYGVQKGLEDGIMYCVCIGEAVTDIDLEAGSATTDQGCNDVCYTPPTYEEGTVREIAAA